MSTRELQRQKQEIRFGPFAVNLEDRELRKAGVRVPLQHKPFHILEMLLRRPGALITRQELANELWPDLHVDFEHSLNSAVNTLRQALEDSSREGRFIETRWGIGYRFIAPIEAAQQPSTHAQHDYLRGRLFLNRMTGENAQRAMGFFHAALDGNPNFALAHAGLADAYCQLALSGTVTASEACRCARESAAAALEAEPNLPQAHVSTGRVHMIFNWDAPKAMEHCNRACELDPLLAEAFRARSLLFATQNRHHDALADIANAQELDPLSMAIGFEHAWILYLSGRSHEAIAQAWTVLTIEPSFAPAQTVLGLAHHQLGAWEDALIELENACTCSARHPAAVAALGHVYGAAGLLEKARGVLLELAEQSKHRHVSRYWFALVYAGLHERNSALQELQRARSQREPPSLWTDVDPRLFALHADPDFIQLQCQPRLTDVK